MRNIVVASILAILATLLWWLSTRGYIQNKTLDRLDRVASISSFCLAVILLVWSQNTRVADSHLRQAKQAVLEVIQTEVEAAQNANIGILAAIYAPDAVLLDKGETNRNPRDDVAYEGWDEIKDRYLKFWTDNKCNSMDLVDLVIEVNKNHAIATHRGVICDREYNQDVSYYELKKIKGKWFIVYLEYDNE
ncbi:MAG: hypothetical protein F6J87_19180 [Spirulina sp. SIO3F2]|nr:hypothetical protein [Spirulina sp. SIO3F2]